MRALGFVEILVKIETVSGEVLDNFNNFVRIERAVRTHPLVTARVCTRARHAYSRARARIMCAVRVYRVAPAVIVCHVRE